MAGKKKWIKNIASKAEEAAKRQHIKTVYGLKKCLIEKKPPGIDSVIAEWLKADIEVSAKKTQQVSKKIWKHIIKLAKKGNLKECKNSRGITRLCHGERHSVRLLLIRQETESTAGWGGNRLVIGRARGRQIRSSYFKTSTGQRMTSNAIPELHRFRKGFGVSPPWKPVGNHEEGQNPGEVYSPMVC